MYVRLYLDYDNNKNNNDNNNSNNNNNFMPELI